MPKKLRKVTIVDAKVTIVDANDRTFTLDNGTIVELKAGVPTEVSKEVADELVAKYPYLKTI